MPVSVCICLCHSVFPPSVLRSGVCVCVCARAAVVPPFLPVSLPSPLFYSWLLTAALNPAAPPSIPPTLHPRPRAVALWQVEKLLELRFQEEDK